MEWIKHITKAINYIENNRDKDLSPDKVSKEINYSSFYFQKGFQILCGVTVSEYIRNRRLSLAAKELQTTDAKIIDIAFKYGYESSDSFSKAFTRFHNVTPLQARNKNCKVKNYLPLKIKISMQGGFEMDYKLVNKEAFKIIGVSKIIKGEEGYKECPKFWDEFFSKGYDKDLMGELAICIDEGMIEGTFKYMIADFYDENKVYEKKYEEVLIPSNTWAIFPCVGKMPESLQNVNTKIFKEWLPQNSQYEMSNKFNIEYYSDASKYPNGIKDDNYYSEIWMPVKAK